MTAPQGAEVRIGQLVAERYRLQRVLGRGSMGVVYEAVHAFTHKHVAIKLLHPDVTSSPIAAGRFLREARAASEIDHPAIVDVLDAGRDSDGTFYLALELLEGEDLAAALDRGDLTLAEIVEVAIQMLEGLAAAHAAGIVHRDMKPENVFLTRNERGELCTKILDFGIAKPLHADMRLAETQKGIVLGTPYYMSPEQALGQDVDARSDIWSAGAVLHRAVAGSPPFDGASYNQLVGNIMQTQQEPLSRLNPQCPGWLAAVVDRALRKRLEERWPAAHHMANALRNRGAPMLDLEWGEEENRTLRTPSPFQAPESVRPPPLQQGPQPASPAGKPPRGIDERAATQDPGGGRKSKAWFDSPAMPQNAAPPATPAQRRAEPLPPRSRLEPGMMDSGAVGVVSPLGSENANDEFRLELESVVPRPPVRPRAMPMSAASQTTSSTGWPAWLKWAAVGAVVLVAGLAGYRGVVALLPGEPTDTEPMAAQQPVVAAAGGTLAVTSEPPGATVLVDDAPLGVAPVVLSDVAPGIRDVTLRLEAYEDWHERIDVRRGGTHSVQGRLVPATPSEDGPTGLLTLESRPRAKVYRQGQLLGRTPLRRIVVPAGVLELELELRNGDRVIRRVFVREGDESATTLDLRAE